MVKRVLSKRLLLHDVSVIVIFSILQGFEDTLSLPPLLSRVEVLRLNLLLLYFALRDSRVLMMVVVLSWVTRSVLVSVRQQRLIGLMV